MDKKSVYKQIGKKISEIRKQKGLTQENFAELMNRSWSSVAKLETSGKNLSIGKLLDIAECLGVDYREFLK